ncbi:hypothetical protein MEX01_09570 [Methylorubrum extorquens]|nr:hypothetical protein MEX01_09570 [Methylorubrum extorquens]
MRQPGAAFKRAPAACPALPSIAAIPTPLPGAAAHAGARAADDLGCRYASPAGEWKTEKTELKNKKIFVCTGRGQGLRRAMGGRDA